MCEDDKAGSESAVSVSQLVLQTKVREDFTITEKAPTNTFYTLIRGLVSIHLFLKPPVGYDLCPKFLILRIIFMFRHPFSPIL